MDRNNENLMNHYNDMRIQAKLKDSISEIKQTLLSILEQQTLLWMSMSLKTTRGYTF